MKKVLVILGVLALSTPAWVSAKDTPAPTLQVVMRSDTPVEGTRRTAFLHAVGEENGMSYALVVFAENARAATAVFAARSGRPKRAFEHPMRVELVEPAHLPNGAKKPRSVVSDGVYLLTYQSVARCAVDGREECDAMTFGGTLEGDLTAKEINAQVFSRRNRGESSICIFEP